MLGERVVITNYGELKAEIANYLNRTDQTDNISTFIKLAETKIYRVLRTRENEFTQVWTDTDDPYNPIDLPQNFREVYLLFWNDKPLEQVDPQAFQRLRWSGLEGEVDYFTIKSRRLYLLPWPDAVPTDEQPFTLEMIYYGSESLGEMATWDTPTNPNMIPEAEGTPPATTERGDDATTRLLQVSPDVLLYGALVEAYLYLREPAKAAEWKPLFVETITDLNMADAVSEYSGSTSAVSSIYNDGRAS